MDVSPMNLQIMVPKSTEVGQMQHNLNQQSAVQQDFEAIRPKADAELKQTQVPTKNDVDGGKIKDDPEHGKKQGQYAQGQRRHSPEKEPEEQQEKLAVDQFRGQHIDISL